MVGIRLFPFGFRPIFRGELLVSGSVCILDTFTIYTDTYKPQTTANDWDILPYQLVQSIFVPSTVAAYV